MTTPPVTLTHAGRRTPLREAIPARVLDARRRYRELELRQRRLLAALAAHNGAVPNDVLALAVNIPPRVVYGLMARLCEVGMAVQTPDGWQLEDAIVPMAQADLRSSVHISLVLPVPDLLKLPCDSVAERRVYEALILLFPHCGVAANVPLKQVVDPAAARLHLAPNAQRYLEHPGTELDVVIYSGRTLLPILAVEADGPQHDRPPQAERDSLKNLLCRTAGLPLMRVRTSEQTSMDVLMHRLKRALHAVARSPRLGQRGHQELAEALARLA